MDAKNMNKKWTNQAVWNNAVWCDIICTTHGTPGEFLDSFWVCQHQAPPFYPNLITLEKHLTSNQIENISELLKKGLPTDVGVKDSYANLDLIQEGFEKLFDGKWIYLPYNNRLPSNDLNNIHWEIVSNEASLSQWELAWRGIQVDELDCPEPMIFLPDLLYDNRLCIIAGYEGRQIAAGAIGLLTDQVVGVSNVFVPFDHATRYRSSCIDKLRTIFPDKPFVGYESANDLQEMLEIGFQEIGSMRVWVRNNTP